MISELNKKLRKLIILTGAILVIFKLLAFVGKQEEENRTSDYQSEENEFQTEEFDDIW